MNKTCRAQVSPFLLCLIFASALLAAASWVLAKGVTTAVFGFNDGGGVTSSSSSSYQGENMQ